MTAYGNQYDYHKTLKELGHVVIPCIPDDLLTEVNAELDDEIINYREFRAIPSNMWDATDGDHTVPSSFHNMTVRKLREWAMTHTVLELWASYVSKYFPGFKLQQGFAPLCEQKAQDGEHAPGIVPKESSSDLFFYGFMNLNSTAIKSDDCIVPPGHILVTTKSHVQCLLLGVDRSKMMRHLHLCWRLTNLDTLLLAPSTNALRHLLDCQDVPGINFVSRPITTRITDANVFNQVVADSLQFIKEHKRVVYPDQPLHSLAHYALELYPKYSNDEMSMFVPNTSWSLRSPVDNRRAKILLKTSV